LTTLRDVLVEYGCGRAAMESTSIYWMSVWHVLESDIERTLANPDFISQLPDRKSDAKDAA
jgi:transposase